MKNHVTKQVMAIAEPPSPIGELRQRVLPPFVDNTYFSSTKQLRTNHFAHESDNIARLICCGASLLAEIARRQAEAPRQRRDFATSTALAQLRLAFRRHRTHLTRPTPTWVAISFFPDQADHQAGTFDRLTISRFQLAESLTISNLFSRLRR